MAARRGAQSAAAAPIFKKIGLKLLPVKRKRLLKRALLGTGGLVLGALLALGQPKDAVKAPVEGVGIEQEEHQQARLPSAWLPTD